VLWDKIAEVYKSWCEIFSFNYKLLSIVIRAYIKNPKYVLDAGCGTGILLKELKVVFPNSEIIGMDISKEMCKISGGIISDFRLIPFKDNTFDLVVFSYSLHEAPMEIEIILNEVSRILKVNGILVIRDVRSDMPSVISAIFYLTLLRFFGEEYVRNLKRKIDLFPNPKEIKSILERNGFEVLRSSEYIFDFEIFSSKK